MNDLKHKILCVEDDKDACELISFIFEQADCEVKTCSQTDCLKTIHEEKYEAIILDNYFDGIKGVDICQEIRGFDQTTPIIFFSGEARLSEIDKALKAGANVYLVKPNDFEKLVPTTLKLIEKFHPPA